MRAYFGDVISLNTVVLKIEHVPRIFRAIYETRRLCLTTFPNIEKRVELTAKILQRTNFEVFRNVFIHCRECLSDICSQSKLKLSR